MELIFDGTVIEHGEQFVTLDGTRTVSYSRTSVSDGVIATVFIENGQTDCVRQEYFLKAFRRKEYIPATLGDGTITDEGLVRPFWSVDGPPTRCPYCGGTDITELDQWAAVSSEDTENTVTLVEWQCVNACGGRAFWV